MRVSLVPISLLLMLFACTPAKKHSEEAYGKVIMDISGKRLTAFPDSVFNKAGLTHLLVGFGAWIAISPLGWDEEPAGRNQIRLLPKQLCAIKTLRVLDLQFNLIDTLPACFVQLKNLEVLDLSFNAHLNIRQCIPVIARLNNLKELALYMIPQAIQDTTWIRHQFDGRNIKLAITDADMTKYYGCHE